MNDHGDSSDQCFRGAASRPRIGAIWQRFKADIERPIAAILNTAAHTIGASVAGAQFDQLFGDEWIWAFSLIFTFLMLRFTEILPRGAGVRYNRRVAVRMAQPLTLLVQVMRPVVIFVHGVNRLFRWRRSEAEAAPATMERITALVGPARLSKEISTDQERIIKRGMRLSQLRVRDIMRPRVEIDALDIDTPSDEVVGAAAMSGFARVPIHEGNMDNIIGFIYNKDILRQLHLGWTIELRKMLHPVVLVPETLRLDQLLELLRKKRTQMAIVLDEYGGTEGLVTVEDVRRNSWGKSTTNTGTSNRRSCGPTMGVGLSTARCIWVTCWRWPAKGVRKETMTRFAVAISFVAVPLAITSLAADPVVQEGWNWSLPAGVEPVEYSGYVTWSGRRFDPAITVRGVMASWKRLNPAPGDYDWDWLRGGGIDFMNSLMDAPAWGSHIDKQGYLIIDDDQPTIREGRFRGDENEEYGKYWEWRFGPVEGYDYRHRISVLRGLQMRQNFQFVSQATLELNPELNEYARIVQGYRRENSPDAWAYLRQLDRREMPIKNIERWLIQRDAPGSRSVAAEPVDRFPLPSERHANATSVRDFDGRRTDVQHGQDGLLFALDRVFWDKPQPAVIKVTYTDRAPARWHVRYTDADRTIRHTASVENTGDGRRKTATFEIPSLSAAGLFPRDAAFLAWRDELPGATGNLVADHDFRGGGAKWHLPAEYQIVGDPERAGGKLVEFTFRPGNNDTVHMDQLVPVKQTTAYRLTASIRNDGSRLKPGVRMAGMDWSTLVYLESEKQGQWETLSDVFTAPADGTVRLQLFGQGRHYAPANQSGAARFRDISVVPVPRSELAGDWKMDFRIVTEGLGDVTVTMVRVVKDGELR